MAHPRLSGFQRLAAVTTGVTLALVALGGAVRATDSGLACPDWPFCYGKVIPRQADIPPETGYTLWNVWLEHTHRLLASIVGVLVLALAVWAVARFRHRRDILWPSVAALVLVIAQAALGAMVVLQQLLAELVTAHLGMAMIVLGLLVYLSVAVTRPRPSGAAEAGPPLALARASAVVAGLCLAQILVGGHVTGIGAGLVWTSWPLIDGALVPAMVTEAQAYHVTHRMLAYALAVAVGLLTWGFLRHRTELRAFGQTGLVLLPVVAGALVLVQIGLGVANLWTGATPWTVVPHLAVASWIWTVLVLQTVLAYRPSPGVGSPSGAARTPAAIPARQQDDADRTPA